MSVQVFPDVGELRIMFVLKDGSGTYEMRLYTAVSGSISQSTVVGDFTEATFGGYAAAPIAWGTPTSSGNKGVMVGNAACVFTCNGSGAPNTILGYYIVENGGGRSAQVVSAEEFDGSYLMENNGDKISVTARWTSSSEN